MDHANTMPGSSYRAAQAESTRGAILAVAERLFAERSLFTVSNRQIGEAAGQGNHTAVGITSAPRLT